MKESSKFVVRGADFFISFFFSDALFTQRNALNNRDALHIGHINYNAQGRSVAIPSAHSRLAYSVRNSVHVLDAER